MQQLQQLQKLQQQQPQPYLRQQQQQQQQINIKDAFSAYTENEQLVFVFIKILF